jgi:hypothetical protein
LTPIPQIYAQELNKVCTENNFELNEENSEKVPKLKSIKEYLYKARKRKIENDLSNLSNQSNEPVTPCKFKSKLKYIIFLNLN